MRGSREELEEDAVEVVQQPEGSAVSRTESEIDDNQSARDGAGVWLGELVALSESGSPLVVVPDGGEMKLLSASTLVELTQDDLGRAVTLMFEKGNHDRPILLGLVENELPEIVDRRASQSCTEGRPTLQLDGQRLIFNATHEIVLRCGQASITLTSNGRVAIRGSHLVSRSSGVNRIKGGSVNIN